MAIVVLKQDKKEQFKSTLCYKCLGCSRLEDMKFEGVKECDNFRRA